MKRVMLMLGTVLLIVGLALSWKGYQMGGQEVATVHLFSQMFGGSIQVYAPTAGWFGRSPVQVGSTEASIAAPTPSPIVDFGAEAEATLILGDGEYYFTPNSAASCRVEPFHTLDIDLELGEVVICSGDDYVVTVYCQCRDHTVSCVSDDGVLSLRNSGTGLNSAQHGCDVVICVPWGRTLDELYVTLDMGSVTLSGLTLNTAYFDLDLGSLTGEDLTVLGDLTASVDLGSVELAGDLAGTTDISADLGSVSLYLFQSASDYTWDLCADLGSVTVNGSDQVSRNGRVTAGHGDRLLMVDASLGSITLEFDAEAAQVAETKS